MSCIVIRQSALIALTIGTLGACTGGPPAERETAAAARRDSVVTGRQPVRELFREYNTGLTDSARTVLTDSVAWIDTWHRTYERRGSPPSRPVVDFSREMVVVVALGRRATGGFTIGIDSARTTGDALEIFVRSLSPGPRCGTTAALTEPAAAIAIPRSTLPVRFVETHQTTDCP